MKYIAIAMSGGVDSSVAAALLLQQGYQVIGLMLHLWNEPGAETTNRCCTPDDMTLARRVAAQLDIPFYTLDARQMFYDTVVQSLLDGYAKNITPNPCLTCNRQLRWGFLLQQALSLGTDALATGHYARLQQDENGLVQLLRATDQHKDQSYVLHLLDQQQLQHTILPLGGYTKSQVRQIARQLGLPVSERPDSQDLCFLGQSDLGTFLLRHAPQTAKPGPILDQDGRQLGEHRGLAFYTIGQRKGLGIAAPQPLYVLMKDPHQNALIVGVEDALGRSALCARQANWIAGQPPPVPFRAQVKIRYKASEAWGWVTPEADDTFRIQFEHPLRDITPGQSAVIYDGETCLGGGIISE